jgi:hypothetical protein
LGATSLPACPGRLVGGPARRRTRFDARFRFNNAANNAHTQLTSIFPNLTSAQIWNMEAMTMLPGIDD